MSGLTVFLGSLCMNKHFLCLSLPALLLCGCTSNTLIVDNTIDSPDDVRAQIESLQKNDHEERERDASVTPELRERGGAAYREAEMANTLYNGHYGANGGEEWVSINDSTGVGVKNPNESQVRNTTSSGWVSGETASPVKGKARSAYGY